LRNLSLITRLSPFFAFEAKTRFPVLHKKGLVARNNCRPHPFNKEKAGKRLHRLGNQQETPALSDSVLKVSVRTS